MSFRHKRRGGNHVLGTEGGAQSLPWTFRRPWGVLGRPLTPAGKGTAMKRTNLRHMEKGNQDAIKDSKIKLSLL